MPMTLFIAVLLAVGSGASGSVQQAQVTPVQKVIQMLNDMMAKGKAEKEDEQVRFATFTQFCKSTTTEKNQAIETTTAEIDDLTADIASYGEEIMTKRRKLHSTTMTLVRGPKKRRRRHMPVKRSMLILW